MKNRLYIVYRNLRLDSSLSTIIINSILQFGSVLFIIGYFGYVPYR